MSGSSASSVVSLGEYAPSPNTCNQALTRANQLRVQALLRQLIVGSGENSSSSIDQQQQQRLDTLRVLRKTLRELDYQLSWLTQVDLLETIERILREENETDTDWRLIHDATQTLIESIPRLPHEIDHQTIEQIFPNVIQNLGHKRSEVRRASLLLLNMYLNEKSTHFQHMLALFIDYGLANHRNQQAQRGSILSLPLLMSEQVVEGEDLLPLIKCLSELLVDANEQLFYSLYLALQRLHLTLGDQKFAGYLRQCDHEATLLYKQAASRNNSLVSTQQLSSDFPKSSGLPTRRKSVIKNDEQTVSMEQSPQPLHSSLAHKSLSEDGPSVDSAKQVTFENGDKSTTDRDDDADQAEDILDSSIQSSTGNNSLTENGQEFESGDYNQDRRGTDSRQHSAASSIGSSIDCNRKRSTSKQYRPPLDHTSSVSSTCSSEANLVNPAHYMNRAALRGQPLANYDEIHHVDHSTTGLAINDLGPVCCSPTIKLGPGAENELKFGIFPRHLVTAASMGSRYIDRLDALQEMMCIIRESPINHLAILMTYFDSFLEQFLARLMETGTDYKVELIAIDMIETIVIKTKISTMQYARPIIGLLMKSLADSRSIFRDNTVRVIHKMMAFLPPQHVIDAIFEHKHSKNALVREEAVNRVTAAVLEYASVEFNLTKLCYHVLPMLADHNAQVRLAALECIASLAHALGPERIGSLLTAAEAVQTGCDYDGLLDAIHARLMRHTLPRCNADGSIRYVIKPFLNLANANYHQEHQAADVRWVLEAPSSHQHPHQSLQSQHQFGAQNHQHHRLGVYSPPDASQRRRSSVNLSHIIGLETAAAEVQTGSPTHQHHHDLHHSNSEPKFSDRRQSRKASESDNSNKLQRQSSGSLKDINTAGRRQSSVAANRSSGGKGSIGSNYKPGTETGAAGCSQSQSQNHDQTKSDNSADGYSSAKRSEILSSKPQANMGDDSQLNEQMQSTYQAPGLSAKRASLKDSQPQVQSFPPTRRQSKKSIGLRRSNSQESTSSTDTNKVLFQYYLSKFKESLVETTNGVAHSALSHVLDRDSNPHLQQIIAINGPQTTDLLRLHLRTIVLPSDSIIYTDSSQAYALSQHQSRYQQTSFDYDSDTVGRVPRPSVAPQIDQPKKQTQQRQMNPNKESVAGSRRADTQSRRPVMNRQKESVYEHDSSGSESPQTIMEAPMMKRDSQQANGHQQRHSIKQSSREDEQTQQSAVQSSEISNQNSVPRRKSVGSRRSSMSNKTNSSSREDHDNQVNGQATEQSDNQPQDRQRRKSLARQSVDKRSSREDCDDEQLASNQRNMQQQAASVESRFGETNYLEQEESSGRAPVLANEDRQSSVQTQDSSHSSRDSDRKSSRKSRRSSRNQDTELEQQNNPEIEIHQPSTAEEDRESRRRASRSQPPPLASSRRAQRGSGKLTHKDDQHHNYDPIGASSAGDGGKVARAISVSPSVTSGSSVNIRHILENVTEVEGPFQDSQLAFRVAMDALDGPCWSTKVEGILALIRLAAFSQTLVVSHLHEVVNRLANETKNLRSTVSRSAIFALGDLCTKLKRLVEPELDTIVQALLNKSIENTAFIRDDIRKALANCVDHLTHWRLANSLMLHGVNHKNVHVRRMASQFVASLVDRMGAAKCLVGARDISAQLIPAAAKFAQDNSPHTRYYGRFMLSRIMQHGAFDRLMRKSLTPNLYRSTLGILESIKRRGPGDPPVDS